MSLVLLVCFITNCDVLVLIYVYELFSINRLFSGWFCKGTNDFSFDQIFKKLFFSTLTPEHPVSELRMQR